MAAVGSIMAESIFLAEKGKKVLSIDMDPQGNMTSGLGVDKDQVENSVYDLIIGQTGIEECICKEVIENLDVLPSNINLSAAEIELIGVEIKNISSEMRWKNWLLFVWGKKASQKKMLILSVRNRLK